MPDSHPGTTTAARRLADAHRKSVACRPVRDLLSSDDRATALEHAYAVQAMLVREWVSRGATVVGRKIGLTNPAVQAQLGVDEPDFGVLLDTMRRSNGDTVGADTLLAPRVEAEIAFVLAHDLDSGELTNSDVRAATSRVVAALEIVDSRIRDWDITILDTIADNGSAALFVLGADAIDLGATDLSAVRMTMTRDGQIVSEGTGTDCLGDPVTALRWLATTLHRIGAPLRVGEVVLSGALGPVVPVEPGALYEARITGLGRVCARFGAVNNP